MVNGVTVNPRQNINGEAEIPLPMIKVKMPKIETWSIQADLNLDFTIFNMDTSLRLTLKDIETDFTAALSSSEEGLLTPIISSINYKVGEKTLDMSNSSTFIGWAAVYIMQLAQSTSNIMMS